MLWPYVLGVVAYAILGPWGALAMFVVLIVGGRALSWAIDKSIFRWASVETRKRFEDGRL